MIYNILVNSCFDPFFFLLLVLNVLRRMFLSLLILFHHVSSQRFSSNKYAVLHNSLTASVLRLYEEIQYSLHCTNISSRSPYANISDVLSLNSYGNQREQMHKWHFRKNSQHQNSRKKRNPLEKWRPAHISRMWKKEGHNFFFDSDSLHYKQEMWSAGLTMEI